VAPDGSEIAPPTKPQPDGTLAKALARAWRWQRMLDEGVYASVSEIGDAENISKSYISRILRLALLSPDVVESILSGQADQMLILKRLERPLPATWKGAATTSGTCVAGEVVLPASWEEQRVLVSGQRDC